MKIERIEIIPKEGGNWVKVYFKSGYWWIPSFEELGKILYEIGKCEDDKYPNGKGAEMVVEFMRDAIFGLSFEELRDKYQFKNKF